MDIDNVNKNLLYNFIFGTKVLNHYCIVHRSGRLIPPYNAGPKLMDQAMCLLRCSLERVAQRAGDWINVHSAWEMVMVRKEKPVQYTS
jgi:hypothetical protein